MQLSDKTLSCRDCHAPFLWTAGEQAFLKERGLLNLPTRCVACRATRRERLGLDPQTATVTELSCAGCGVRTTVPFVPNNGKPIYCSPCFAQARLQAEAKKLAMAPATGAQDVVTQ